MLRSLFVVVLIFATLPVILFKPHVGVLVWSWISYMNPHRLTYGMAYSFGFLTYVAGATIVGAFLAREPKKLPPHPLTWLLLAYWTWVSLTTLTAAYPEMAVPKWTLFSKILLFTLITTMFMQSKGRLHSLIWVIVLSLGFFGIKGGIFTILTGGSARVWGPPDTFIEDNNQFALAIVMLVPLIRYLYSQATIKLMRWILLGMMLTSVFAIFGTQSRGALVAITAMVLFLVWKSKRFIFGVMVLVVVGSIGLVFMPESWRDRMSTISEYETDQSAQGRITMWKFAIDVANDHPVMGGGFNIFYDEGYRAAYLPEGAIGRAVHSIYFEVLGEHGYIGLILFLLIGITTFFTGSAIIERTRNHADLKWAKELAAMLQVSVVGYAAAGAFLNLATFDLYYHIIAITVILRVMVEKLLAEKAATAVPVSNRTLQPPAVGSQSPSLLRDRR